VSKYRQMWEYAKYDFKRTLQTLKYGDDLPEYEAKVAAAVIEGLMEFMESLEKVSDEELKNFEELDPRGINH
jgi:hypothetical protein